MKQNELNISKEMIELVKEAMKSDITKEDFIRLLEEKRGEKNKSNNCLS